jgi:hypothetical protein
MRYLLLVLLFATTVNAETITEYFEYSDYVVKIEARSIIDPERIGYFDYPLLRCPGTEEHIELLEIGETDTCLGGLKITRIDEYLIECELNR